MGDILAGDGQLEMGRKKSNVHTNQSKKKIAIDISSIIPFYSELRRTSFLF